MLGTERAVLGVGERRVTVPSPNVLTHPTVARFTDVVPVTREGLAVPTPQRNEIDLAVLCIRRLVRITRVGLFTYAIYARMDDTPGCRSSADALHRYIFFYPFRRSFFETTVFFPGAPPPVGCV